MQIYAGTSGFSYPEWVGSFYPAGTQPAEMLSRYARQLPAVEINNTFYRMPKKAMLENWRAQVPDTFRFVIKASRRITHSKKLSDTRDEMEFLCSNLSVLGDALGAVLFQLPPFLRKDRIRLEKFLEQVPQGIPPAFEFRHPSWFDDEIADLLRAYNSPWVITETRNDDSFPALATADWGYLRLRRPDYKKTELLQWQQRVAAAKWRCVWVFFKHEEDCAGPALAQHFLALQKR